MPGKKSKTHKRVLVGIELLKVVLKEYESDGDGDGKTVLEVGAVVAGAFIAGLSTEEMDAALRHRRMEDLIAQIRRMRKITDDGS